MAEWVGFTLSGINFESLSSYAVIKKKTLLRRIFLFMAEWVGFEPTCRYYRQTDFESAPL